MHPLHIQNQQQNPKMQSSSSCSQSQYSTTPTKRMRAKSITQQHLSFLQQCQPEGIDYANIHINAKYGSNQKNSHNQQQQQYMNQHQIKKQNSQCQYLIARDQTTGHQTARNCQQEQIVGRNRAHGSPMPARNNNNNSNSKAVNSNSQNKSKQAPKKKVITLSPSRHKITEPIQPTEHMNLNYNLNSTFNPNSNSNSNSTNAKHCLKNNYSSIIQSIANRIQYLQKEDCAIDNHYETIRNQVQYARPSDIKIYPNGSNMDTVDSMLCNYQILKQIVAMAINQYPFIKPSSNNANGSMGSGTSSAVLQCQSHGSQFHSTNLHLEQKIQQKMCQIQTITQSMKTCVNRQSALILELQNTEEQLRSILKAKGSIIDAEAKQKDKKNISNDIKCNRDAYWGLVSSKINSISQVIKMLQALYRFRQERKNKIQNLYQFGGGFETVKSVLHTFVGGLEQLKQQRDKLNLKYSNIDKNTQNQQRISFGNNGKSSDGGKTKRQSSSIKKKILQDLNLNSTLTPRYSMNTPPTVNPFNFSNKEQANRNQFSNQNRLQTKKMIGNLYLTNPNIKLNCNANENGNASSQQQMNLFSFELDQSQQNQNCTQTIHLQFIMQQYEQILAYIQKVKELESIYFKNKKQKLQQQFKVKALEKVYLVGVIGYDPVQDAAYDSVISCISNVMNSNNKYESILASTIKKCNTLNLYNSECEKQHNKLLNKLSTVEESIQLLNGQIQVLGSEKCRKKQTVQQIQQLIEEKQEEFNKINNHKGKKLALKQMYQQYQKLKIKKSMLEKQLQQQAEQGNLDGYKKIKIIIEDIDNQISLMDKKIEHEQKNQMKSSCYGNIGSFNYTLNGNLMNSGNGIGNSINGLGYQNQMLMAKIKQIMDRNNVYIDLAPIKFKNYQQLMNKISRRFEIA